MIKFKNRNKQQVIAKPTSNLPMNMVNRVETTFNEVFVHGACLPGYEKLSQHKKKRKTGIHLSNSLQHTKDLGSKEEICGLFKNTAIRRRIKSIQLSINLTSAKPIRLERKHSYQKDITQRMEQFIKTSSIMYDKPKSERYIGAFAALNWTNRSNQTKQPIKTQPAKCHPTKYKLQKEERQSIFRPGRASQLQNFNDSLLAQCEKYLCFRKAGDSRDAQFRLSSYEQSIDSSLRQSASLSRPKSKVCYSIKLRKQQQAIINETSHIHSGKLAVKSIEEER